MDNIVPQQSKGLLRNLPSNIEQVLRGHVLKVCLVALVILTITFVFSPRSSLQERSLLFGLALFCIFLQRRGGTRKHLVSDLLLCVATIFVFGYVFIYHEVVEQALPGMETQQLILGIILIPLCILASKRQAGWAVPIVFAFFFAYLFLGRFIPYDLGGHFGFSLQRIITHLYLSYDSIFGSLASIVFKYIFLFLLFGKILEASGAISYMMDLALIAVGRFRGGPALVAVISSGLMGSISGSSAANVMITGAYTIPTMKRIGLKPHIAGAVEASASTGGLIMPPVMAGAAFMIMLFLPVTYVDIMKAAIIPAVLYFASVLSAVYIHSASSGIRGLPAEELPKPRRLLRVEGLTLLCGISALVILLLSGFSVPTSALYGSGIVLVLSQLSKNRVGPRRLVKAMVDTSRDFLTIAGLVATIGLLIGTLYLSGLVVRLCGVLLIISGGQLFVVLLLTMVVAFIMGMGMSSTPVYVILAMMLAAPIIQLGAEIGINPLAVHMFIFYTALYSMVTPPVAIAAYAAATIAHADFWKTGVYAAAFSAVAYVLPFVFLYDNALLGMAPFWEVLSKIGFTWIGLTLLCFVIFARLPRFKVILRMLALIATICLLIPELYLHIIGLVLAIFLTAFALIVFRRKPKRLTDGL